MIRVAPERPDGVGGGPQPDFGFARMEGGELGRLWRERPVVGLTRADYVRLTALRAEVFSRLSTPASVKKWGKEGSK